MKTSLEFIIDEAISYAAQAFDADQDISGAELVEWFADWRQRARMIVCSNRSPQSADYCQQFHSQLIDALRALKLMQDRAQVEGRPMNQLSHRGRTLRATDAQSEELIHALNSGGVMTNGSSEKWVLLSGNSQLPRMLGTDWSAACTNVAERRRAAICNRISEHPAR